jgi:aspartate 1-decarboxylase
MAGPHSLHRSGRRGRASRRLRVALAALTAAVVAVAGVAVAFFSSTGNGLGTATTGTLAPPTAVAGAQTPGTGTVTVLWHASTGTPAPSGYYVTRQPASGPAQPACGTSAASTTSATSCSDAGVAPGSYTYVVVAVYRSWTATSASSDPVTVGQTAQSITFTSSPTAPTYGGSYTVTATGGASGNPVTFSSATTGVCTVAGATVTFVHAGTCTIDADQAGSTYYSAAPQAHQTFTVAKAPQAVTFTSTAPAAAVVGGPGYTPTATGGASGNPVTLTVDASTSATCSISGGVVTYQHAGSCTIDADQAGAMDYLAANQVQQSYAVGKGAQAISFTSTAPSNAKVGDTYSVTATGGASGNPVVLSSGSPAVCTVSGSTVSFVGAGTCAIDADQAGTADYLAATQVQQSVTVTRRDQTVSFTTTAPSNAKVGGSYAPAAT